MSNEQIKGTLISRADFLRLSAGAVTAGAALTLSGPFSGLTAKAASNPMLARKIPKSGEMIPVIGLGTAQSFGYAGDVKTYNARKDVLRTFLAGGGKMIDTSPTYSDAEEVVGRGLVDLGLRDKAFIATKISTYGKQSGIDQHRQSVGDLRTPLFDLLQVHNLKDTKDHLATIRRLKGEGKVRYAGITHFRTSAHDVLADVMRREPLDFVQVNYSMTSRAAAKTILPLALDKGIAVIINVPFARGRLFGQVRGKKLPPWAVEFDAHSWGHFFLKFLLANEAVTVVIPGTTKVKHVRDNLGAGQGRLPTKAHLKKMIDFIDSL